jgi:hypothetical protein
MIILSRIESGSIRVYTYFSNRPDKFRPRYFQMSDSRSLDRDATRKYTIDSIDTVRPIKISLSRMFGVGWIRRYQREGDS